MTFYKNKNTVKIFKQKLENVGFYGSNLRKNCLWAIDVCNTKTEKKVTTLYGKTFNDLLESVEAFCNGVNAQSYKLDELQKLLDEANKRNELLQAALDGATQKTKRKM